MTLPFTPNGCTVGASNVRSDPLPRWSCGSTGSPSAGLMIIRWPDRDMMKWSAQRANMLREQAPKGDRTPMFCWKTGAIAWGVVPLGLPTWPMDPRGPDS